MNAYKLLVRKPEGKRPLGRPRCRTVDNLKMDLGEIELGVLTGLVWFRIGTSVELCECGNEPPGSIKYWEVLEWLLILWPLE
jgi:hypothetical protein